jgi:hypothetical protein
LKGRRKETQMDNLTQAYSLLFGKNVPNLEEYNVKFPEFPLWWLDKSKRNMEGLREIASHLHTKTAEGRISRAGFVGETSEMEKQIIRNLIDLEQQVYALTDVLQSVIQIVVEEHERRISQRIKRTAIRVWNKARSYGNRLWENPIFKVLGGLSTIAFFCTMIAWAIHSLWK